MIHSEIYGLVQYMHSCSSLQNVLICSLLLHCLCSHERWHHSFSLWWSAVQMNALAYSSSNPKRLKQQKSPATYQMLRAKMADSVSPRLIDRGFINLASWSKINSVDQTLSSLRSTLPSELCPHNTISKPHQPHRQIKTCSCILLPLQCNMCVRELSLSLFEVRGVIPKHRLCKTLKQHRDRQSKRSPCWKNHTHRGTCQQVHLITISCLQMFGILWQM